MKKVFLRKLLLLFSSVVFLVYGFIYACAGGDWDWFYYESNFTPETFVDKSYTPLFVSNNIFYSTDYYGFDNIHNSRFNDEITTDWENYLIEKTDHETVKHFLTNDSSFVDVNGLYEFLSNKKANDLSRKWQSKLDLKNKKVKAFITFLYFAKQVETASVIYDRWNYEETVSEKTIDASLIPQIENKYRTTKDKFLKNRYWFQLIKAHFYNKDFNKVVAFFTETSNEVPKNTLYYRALAYVAGTHYAKKEFAQSNYLYSQVFDHCPTMRVVSAYCFKPQEQTDWNNALQLAKTNQEKAALWAIQGYHVDENKAIAEIFELDPKSEHLEFLLTRLVNHQEQLIDKSFKNKTVKQYKKASTDSVSKTAIALVDKIASSKNTLKPYLWNCSAGYLQTLQSNFSKADDYFDKAEKELPKTDLANNQLRLLRFINNLSKIDHLNSKTEATVLADLNWLYFELPKQNESVFRYTHASDWSKKYISTIYKDQKNVVMTELFEPTEGFYHNETHLQALKNFLAQTNKTPFEEIAANIYHLKLADINEYQAVLATFQNKIPEAITFMQQADTLQNITLLANPFTGNIKDCNDCDHAKPQSKKYSQLEFLTTIQIMQNKAAKNEEVYTNALLLGNAFYNITHFGNARLFYEGNIIGYSSSPHYFDEKYKQIITNCSLAKKYYEMAFSAAKNNEQKAKCQYLLAKCERNEYYNKRYDTAEKWWNEEYNTLYFISWNGFKNLKTSYNKTNYYKEVLAECGYFKKYLGVKN